MKELLIITPVCLLLSFMANRAKTIDGTAKGIRMFVDLLPALLTVLAMVSIALYFLPDEVILQYLNKFNGVLGIAVAALIGSIALIPGFIAFPIAGILAEKGINHMVLAVFITTLMMVGIFTLPIEIKYLGKKAAIARNILSLIGAVVIGLLVGLFM